MGFTYVKVRVYNPADLARSEVVELLVDSGAIFTSIPQSVLEKIGVKPVARRKLKVYGGGIVERDTGVGIIEYEGVRAGAPVIFGKQEDTSILGATTLEALGYQVDPVTKKLKPIELLMV
jgi:predicted aspartyl protease